MLRDWIEPKTLPLVRRAVARIDRRRYDVMIAADRVVVSERPSGAPRCFYLLHQLEDFCAELEAAASRRTAGRRDGEAALPWRARWEPPANAAAEKLKNEVARLHETVTILRGQRRNAETERDRWERLARNLESELLGGRGVPLAKHRRHPGSDKFRRAKKAVARLTHPDSVGATGIEATIREKLFKEFWAEFERIEAEP